MVRSALRARVVVKGALRAAELARVADMVKSAEFRLARELGFEHVPLFVFYLLLCPLYPVYPLRPLRALLSPFG